MIEPITPTPFWSVALAMPGILVLALVLIVVLLFHRPRPITTATILLLSLFLLAATTFHDSPQDFMRTMSDIPVAPISVTPDD